MKTHLLLLTTFVTLQSFGDIQPSFFVNGKAGANLVPNTPSLIEMKYLETDEEGNQAVIKDIKNVMGKVMHMVVVKSDLSSFAHFHPFFDEMSGLFQAPVNLQTIHPDNQDAARAFPEPGHYLIYTESKSKEKGILMHALDQKAEGAATLHPLVADRPNADGVYVHYLKGDGSKGTEGDRYRTEIRVTETAGAGGDLLAFDFLLQEKQENGGYVEVKSLQPWLMMGGHAILLGSRGEKAKDRVFAHEHSGRPESGGRLSFSHFARGGLPADVYRMWMQFKHADRVLTLPLTFAYPF